MEYLFAEILKSFSVFYHSVFFGIIKFLLGIYTVVLLVDLILVIILKGFWSDLRVTLKGMDMPLDSKNNMRKKWKKITDRLISDNSSQYKVAILEADMLVNKILSDMHIPGSNMIEKLEFLQPEQVPNREELKQAHLIRNKIIHEKDFTVEKEKAREILEIFERFLLYLELL